MIKMRKRGKILLVLYLRGEMRKNMRKKKEKDKGNDRTEAQTGER